MKKIVFITLSLLIAVSFWNCEKDDICAEGTPVTPRLIIEFYDAANPSVLKNVTNLRVEEFGTDEGVVFNENLLEKIVSNNPVVRKLDSIEHEKQILLIVDDHTELRKFVADIFSNRFQTTRQNIKDLVLKC